LALSGSREGGGILIVELYRKVRLARRGGMNMGVKQHLMGLQGVSPQQKSPHV